MDFRETNGSGGTTIGSSGGILPERSRQHATAAALVASIERCSEPIQKGRSLQTDIREIRRIINGVNVIRISNDVREIRRIIKAYVGRLQDREVTNHVAREWRIVARVLDRLFFMLYVFLHTNKQRHRE